MKLSIIIPFYNKEPYIYELLDCLQPQLKDDIEVVIVDDGSINKLNIVRPHMKVIRKENGGVSSARNVGIDNSTGEYISFIDADDLVSDTFVRDILNRTPFHYLDMSWKTIPGCIPQYDVKLNSENDKLNNPSVCTRVFSRKFIGDLRFNENKDGAEDEEFTRKLGLDNAWRAVITKYSYFYRTSTDTSATKKYLNGGLKTKRIIYNYSHVLHTMTHLIEEIKEEDKYNEVIVMTYKNDIPELEMYARVIKPMAIRGMELRGEPTDLFTLIPSPIHTQVVLWTDTTYSIGGIETFIYNFCQNMKDYYDITVLYRNADVRQIARLTKIVQTIKNNTDIPIICDTLIVNRLADKVPENIIYGKKIQMCHTCKIRNYEVPEDNNGIVYVSEVAKNSFAKDGYVINNMTYITPYDKPLILLSATRLNTPEKGDKRMVQFAQHLKKNNIKFLWFIFSETKIKDPVEGMIFLNPTLDIYSYMSIADYVVQLSSSESFCYSIVEALQMGIPVLTSALDVLAEIGFKDAENGYILPGDMSCIDFKEIAECKLKGFKYKYDNKKRVAQWRELLGDTVPKKDYKYKPEKVIIKAPYFDVIRQENMKKGTECMMLPDRAAELRLKGLVI